MAHRRRLLLAALIGAAAGVSAFLLGVPGRAAVLGGWCIAAVAWLVLVLPSMGSASARTLRVRTEELDEGGATMLMAVLVALIASLGAVVYALAPQGSSVLMVTLGFVTLALSWLCVHVLFAVHYAHEHCRLGEGVTFPGNDEPDFWEFLYFALTIGMTFQVSDATTTTPRIRRMVIWHAAVSFLFNAAILGAAVNVAATLAQ
jgi:uncharacterized membrane protein